MASVARHRIQLNGTEVFYREAGPPSFTCSTVGTGRSRPTSTRSQP